MDAGQALVDGYSFRVLDDASFRVLFTELRPKVFGERFEADLYSVLDREEQEATNRLGARMGTPYRLNVGVFHEGACVGWSTGWQKDAEMFQMVNTGFLAEHRGRGLYRALLPRVLGIIRAEGFQVVTSRHHPTNNAVLVPKLKAGFVITQFEVSDRFGLLVYLSYFFNARRRHLVNVRVGYERPDDAMRATLGLP